MPFPSNSKYWSEKRGPRPQRPSLKPVTSTCLITAGSVVKTPTGPNCAAQNFTTGPCKTRKCVEGCMKRRADGQPPHVCSCPDQKQLSDVWDVRPQLEKVSQAGELGRAGDPTTPRRPPEDVLVMYSHQNGKDCKNKHEEDGKPLASGKEPDKLLHESRHQTALFLGWQLLPLSRSYRRARFCCRICSFGIEPVA